MENILTIESLLLALWRYEPDILTLIFKFLFVPVYEDTEKKSSKKKLENNNE